MGTFGRRQVLLGAAMASLAAVLPAAPGAVLRGHRLNALRPLARGEAFDLVFEAVDGSRRALSCVVVDRSMKGDELTYDLRAGASVAVAADLPLGVRTRKGA